MSVDGDLAASLQNALKQCLGPLDDRMTSFLEFLRSYGPQKSRPLLHKNLLFWYEVERYKIMFKSDPDNVSMLVIVCTCVLMYVCVRGCMCVCVIVYSVCVYVVCVMCLCVGLCVNLFMSNTLLCVHTYIHICVYLPFYFTLACVKKKS